MTTLTGHFEGDDVLQQPSILGLFGECVWAQSEFVLLHSGDSKGSSQTISTVAHRFRRGELGHSRKLHTHTHTHHIMKGCMGEKVTFQGWLSWCVYLRSKVSHSDASDQAQPLAQGLGLVERQHGLSHLTAVTDRNVRHELHSSRHDCVTLTSSNQTNSCGQ